MQIRQALTLPAVHYPYQNSSAPTLSPPSTLERLGELAAVGDFARGLASGLWWKHEQRDSDTFESERPQVILLPGFYSSPRAMFSIKNMLKHQGYPVSDWGLGFNDGNAPELLDAMTEKLKRLHSDGERVILIGWSLGGYVAREAARECPEAVLKVITLGTPVIGGPRYTAAAGFYTMRGWDLDEIDHETLMRYETELQVPVVAIYSRRDGVVAWQACVDQISPNVTHIEVDCTHLGMAYAPPVLRVLEQECKNTPSHLMM